MQKNNEISFFEIFPWTDNFDTGIEIIDEQHKQLVNILNRLAAHLANLSSDIILNEIFDELAAYADYHFKTEEKIWSKNFKNDEWFTEHEHTHDTFIDQVLKLKNNTQNKPLENTITEVVSFLSKWLAYHILDTDKRMAKAVLAMQGGRSLEDAKNFANTEMQGSMQVLIHTVLDMYDNLSHRTLELMKEKTLRKRAEEALLQSEERWDFILKSGSEDIWDWDILEEKVLVSDDKTLSLNALSNDQFSNIYEADKERVYLDLKEHLKNKTDFFTSKYRVVDINGKFSWILSKAKVVSRTEDGQALRMIGTHSNITERELASLLYKNSSQAMLVTDINNTILSINPAFTKITGYTEEDSIGKNPKFLSANTQNISVKYTEMWKSLMEKGSWSGELQNKRKNGEIYTELLNINTILNSSGKIDYYVGLFTDISDKKKVDALLLKQACTDSLTELYNRSMFQDKLEQIIKEASRNKSQFALLFIDLDHFKNVNDNLGHASGDLLLIKIVERIHKLIRKSDIFSRFGGDEFAIIFPKLKASSFGIDKTIKNILNALSKPFDLDKDKVYISASIGVSLYPQDATTASGLLVSSDQAMYLAKKSGRNCYRYFRHQMQEKSQQRHLLINDLYIALEKKQFEVYYQPIESLETDKIIKAEALIRWNHPTKGLLYPDSFISIAEESGLIINIGDFVFKEATQQIQTWKDKYNVEFQISINKSPVQFKSEEVISSWTKHLHTLNIDPQNIVIEITENIFMENEALISKKLLQLQDLGMQISLDDFGTGYSSLSYLRNFNVDYLKIDRSFVMNFEENNQDILLCEAIISMAHKLGIEVIAEGIETVFQRKKLFAMDCNYGQGYLLAKPIPVKDFENLVFKS